MKKRRRSRVKFGKPDNCPSVSGAGIYSDQWCWLGRREGSYTGMWNNLMSKSNRKIKSASGDCSEPHSFMGEL